MRLAFAAQYSFMLAFHAMRSFCNRDTIALKGLASYFKDEMDRQSACALLWSDYQTKRGGNTHLLQLKSPEHDFSAQEGDAVRVLETKLALERLKYSKLDAMHNIADETKDKHFQDLIEEKMGVQLTVLKKNADWLNQLRRVGPGHGTWNWDKSLAAAYHGTRCAVLCCRRFACADATPPPQARSTCSPCRWSSEWRGA
jgi:ferritin heavy chain